MRTGGSIDQEEVLLVCINEDGLAIQLRHTPNAIRNAVTLLKWGKAGDSAGTFWNLPKQLVQLYNQEDQCPEASSEHLPKQARP